MITDCIYYIGYTCQCVVTKSAQTCLTNDPKQRPLFAVFDCAYTTIAFIVYQMALPKLVAKHGNTMYSAELFHELWIYIAILSAIFTCIAVFCIAPKDKSEYFGTGVATKVTLKDYWDTLKNNRAIQMLVVSASSDKLAQTTKTSAVTIVMFAIIAGNYSLSGTISAITSIPIVLISMIGISTIATRLGQKKAMVIGSWGGLIVNALLAALWLYGDATSMSTPEGKLNLGLFAISHIVLSIVAGLFQGLSGNIVITMTADCADYEVARTGKYVPGMMGTLFSFVDKMISSFAPMITGLMFAAIGFKEALPDVETPYSTSLHYVAIFLMYGMIIIGLICNIIAMKFYPLTKEKMAEVQAQIQDIKNKAR